MRPTHTAYSRTQWYLLTIVRLTGVLLLIVVIGDRVDQMGVPTWIKMTVGAVVVVAGTMAFNQWAIGYETYLKDQESENNNSIP